jgi:hypothetical protein
VVLKFHATLCLAVAHGHTDLPTHVYFSCANGCFVTILKEETPLFYSCQATGGHLCIAGDGGVIRNKHDFTPFNVVRKLFVWKRSEASGLSRRNRHA